MEEGLLKKGGKPQDYKNQLLS